MPTPGWPPTSAGRRHLPVLAVLVAIALVVGAAACGKDNAASPSSRPTTAARLQTLQPAPNQATGPDVKVELRLLGARVVQPTTSKLRPDEGHIHLSLDGRLVTMTYGTTQELNGLKPGPHALQAEFVAADHKPFANRVVAAVLFTVRR